MANIGEIVQELQQERDRLNQAIAALAPLVGANTNRLSSATATAPHRTLSAAARRKVSLAQKARWARLRAEKGQPRVASVGKRTISAAGLARIRAATRARWARWRVAHKKAA